MSAPTTRRRIAFSAMPLAWQLVLLAVVPALLALAGVVLLVTRHYLGEVETITRAHAHTVALQVANWSEAPLASMDRRALTRIARLGTAQSHIRHVQIWSDEGELLAESHNDQPASRHGLSISVPVVSTSGQPIGQVTVEVSLEALDKARRTAWVTAPVALSLALVIVALLGGWAARRISTPIHQLADAVDRLGAGQDVRVDVGGAAEVRHLQTGFNAAAKTLSDSRRLLERRIREATAELERKNQQIERSSQAKTRLLAAASHDLRQPLHALSLFSEGLASSETDPKRLQRIGHIQECVDSLSRLFTELLNISQIDAGVLKPQWSRFALDRLFDDISPHFRPIAEAQELRLVLRHTQVWVYSDYYMLSRILSNLVSNALRHTRTGGVLVGARLRGDQVCIEVVDTGAGIPQEHQAQVFEEFYQVDDPQHPPQARQGRGLGLGLSTVQRLAALLHIRVELQSQPGRGTRVRVWVPCTEAPPDSAHPPAALPDTDARLDGLRLLVVDDEPIVLEGLRVALSVWGAEVITANSVQAACTQADSWTRPPDAIITDLWLGGGETGLDVLRALADHPQGIGLHTARFIVTAETKPERLHAAIESGVPIFQKPLSLQLLRKAIGEHLRQR